MSDVTEAQAAPNKTMLILLGVIVVLLAAIVVIFLVRGSAEPVATGTGTEAPAATPTMPGAVAPVEFDPATATKVPAGETPEQYVITYFDAVVAGDYATAYDRLPTDKKAASTEAEYAAQLADYGIASYTIDSSTEEGDQAEVLATATMPGGAFTYLWTFVKDGDGWLVKSRTLPGMGQ